MAKKIEVIVSRTARQDLTEILEYLKIESPQSAQKLVSEMRQRLSKLSTFPKLGRMIPELAEFSLREIIVGPYRLMYRLDPNKVVLLRIFHGRRLFPEDL